MTQVREGIEQFVKYIEKYINYLAADISRLLGGGGADLDLRRTVTSRSPLGKISGSLAHGIIEFLRQSGLNRRQFEIAVDKKYQIYTMGDGPIAIPDQSYPLHKRVLLLTKDEFGNIQRSMGKLVYASNRENARQSMYDTWMEVLRSYVGELDPEEMSKMPLSEVNRMVFDLPGTNPLLRDVKLIDILDEQRMPTSRFDEYRRRIEEKHRKLRRIYNMDGSDYPYSFRSAEFRYYWIEEDLIP